VLDAALLLLLSCADLNQKFGLSLVMEVCTATIAALRSLFLVLAKFSATVFAIELTFLSLWILFD
jgi:hypothetical protein